MILSKTLLNFIRLKKLQHYPLLHTNGVDYELANMLAYTAKESVGSKCIVQVVFYHELGVSGMSALTSTLFSWLSCCAPSSLPRRAVVFPLHASERFRCNLIACLMSSSSNCSIVPVSLKVTTHFGRCLGNLNPLKRHEK